MFNPVKAFKEAAKEMDEDFYQKFEDDWQQMKKDQDKRMKEMQQEMYRPRVNADGSMTIPIRPGGFF